ncbi:hypothetical protein [Amphritea pacifica]|uniref:Uncharacterized protein n=1 Tax=Amphritea pacifica TaxID=2811233 RepID=A0ABS2WDN6_9GAMM|nr:hypothetical protein [Amphritea pacifica]MBN0989726.1 hypothetical protein [Amphritea pacifica]MBN1007395.1 hypothetical protein [Amphritea pacifica]
MASRAFTLQRICNFAGKAFDPDSDEQVSEVLRNKFNISLPQRRTLNDAMEAVCSDHDIIALILQYRTMA